MRMTIDKEAAGSDTVPGLPISVTGLCSWLDVRLILYTKLFESRPKVVNVVTYSMH